jgi:hypothetical protein
MIDCGKEKMIIEEFAEEIASGRLNILCYRSGLKFDLFGMDYSGPQKLDQWCW